MAIIGCTTKLLSELAQKPLAIPEGDRDVLQCWHANLLLIQRQKCVLLVNDATLFNFIIPESPAALRGRFGQEFKLMYSCVLAEEGFDDAKRQQVLSAYDHIQLGKTSNRKIIGSMNDLAMHYQYHITQAGSLQSYQVPEIIKRMNRIPCKAIHYQYPIEMMQQAFSV